MSKWKPTSASERIMTKIASHDPSLIAVCSVCRMSKKAESIADTINNWGQKAMDWASKDNYRNLKNVGIGLGTGLGTYALSGLVPGAGKYRGLRALGALGAGIGAGMYGDQIRQGAQSLWDKTPWRQKEIQAASDAKAKADADAKAKAEAAAKAQAEDAAKRSRADLTAQGAEYRKGLPDNPDNPSNQAIQTSAPPADADVNIPTNVQSPADIEAEKAQRASMARPVAGNVKPAEAVTIDSGEDDEDLTLHEDNSPDAKRQRALQAGVRKLKGFAESAVPTVKGAYGTFKKHWDEAGKRVAEQQAQQQADAEARALEHQLVENDVTNRPELTGDTAAGRFVDNAVSSARRGTADAASAVSKGYTAFGDFVNGNQYGDNLGAAPEARAEQAIRAEWDKQEATMRRAGWDENRINRSRDLFFRSKRQEARKR